MQTVTNNHIHVLLGGDIYVAMHFYMGFSYLMFQTAAVKYVYFVIIFPQGKGLIAKRSFKKGDTIFIEQPLVSSQFLWNASYKYRGECLIVIQTSLIIYW